MFSSWTSAVRDISQVSEIWLESRVCHWSQFNHDKLSLAHCITCSVKLHCWHLAINCIFNFWKYFLFQWISSCIVLVNTLSELNRSGISSVNPNQLRRIDFSFLYSSIPRASFNDWTKSSFNLSNTWQHNSNHSDFKQQQHACFNLFWFSSTIR